MKTEGHYDRFNDNDKKLIDGKMLSLFRSVLQKNIIRNAALHYRTTQKPKKRGKKKKKESAAEEENLQQHLLHFGRVFIIFI